MADPILLRKLLLAVCEKGKIKPKPADFWEVFDVVDGVYNSQDPDTLKNIFPKWINGSARKATGIRLTVILKYINYVLFGVKDEKEYVVRNLDRNFDDLPLSKSIIDKVNHICQQKRIRYGNGYIVGVSDYKIKPSDINSMVPRGKIESTHFYQSPRSAIIWDRVKGNWQKYPLYFRCERGLAQFLASSKWLDKLIVLDLVFCLGAGSASKDKLILESLNNNNVEDVEFIWVDSSDAMLEHTIAIIDNEKLLGNVAGLRLRTSFENPRAMKVLYEGAFFDGKPFNGKGINAFFILGFTLSNLDETAFFKSYKKVCKKGDLFIFPVQFIPKKCANSIQELQRYKKTLMENYDFPDGRRLAEEGLEYIDGYTPVKHPEPEVKTFFLDDTEISDSSLLSLKLEYSVTLKDQNGVKQNVIVSCSKRHYEKVFMDMLKKHNFIKIMETDEINGVKTLVVEFIGN